MLFCVRNNTFVVFHRSLSAVIKHFDHSSQISRAYDCLYTYCHKPNLPALTSYQALYVLCSHISQESNRKEPLLLALVTRSDTRSRERPRTNIRPCHCAGIQTDLAIVQVYQSIRPSHCAGIFKQYYPALLDSKQNCLPTCRAYITDEITNRLIYTKF